MTQSFLYRMPAGIPGDVNRAQQCVIRPEVITPNTGANPTVAPGGYGLAVVIDQTTGQLRTAYTADAAAAIAGFLARPFPTNSSTSGLGTSVPPTSGVVDLMMRGFMAVQLSGLVAAKNGLPVYIYLAASNASYIQGGAQADNTGGAVLLPGCFFSGAADANGNTEISFLP